VRVRPDGLYAFDHGGDLLLGRALFHHDHHLSLKPLRSCTSQLAVRMRSGVRRGDGRVSGHVGAAAGPDA
jgi:hypothetical protein